MGKWLVLLAMLLLPAASLAVTEGVVQPADVIAMDAVQTASAYYKPDESYAAMQRMEPSWAESDEYVQPENRAMMRIDVALNTGLTPGEARRAQRIMERVKDGEMEASGGETIIGVRENVILGVYPLDEATFDGERVYTLLPGTCLTDEQLLALIDAYDLLGLEFDPEALTYRNCMRGGNAMRSRQLAAEEWTRSAQLDMLIQRGMVDASLADEAHAIRLHPDYYLLPTLGNGEKLAAFQLLPYCPLSDEELIADSVLYGTRDLSREFDLDALEARAYHTLAHVLNLPLSLKLSTIYADREPWTDMEVKWEDGDRLLIMSFGYRDEAGAEKAARVCINQRTLEEVYVQLRNDDGGYDQIRLTGVPDGYPAVQSGEEVVQ